MAINLSDGESVFSDGTVVNRCRCDKGPSQEKKAGRVPDDVIDPVWMDLDIYMHDVEMKIHRGRDEYGDASYSRNPCDLIGELKEECLDLAGWGFVLWRKLDAMEQAIHETFGKIEKARNALSDYLSTIDGVLSPDLPNASQESSED